MTGDGDAKTATNSVNAADGKAGAKDKAQPVVTYQFAQKPDVKPGWEGFKQFLWNSETKQFLGRTGCSWCKLLFFITIPSLKRIGDNKLDVGIEMTVTSRGGGLSSESITALACL
jgi:hypothetical protein